MLEAMCLDPDPAGDSYSLRNAGKARRVLCCEAAVALLTAPPPRCTHYCAPSRRRVTTRFTESFKSFEGTYRGRSAPRRCSCEPLKAKAIRKGWLLFEG